MEAGSAFKYETKAPPRYFEYIADDFSIREGSEVRAQTFGILSSHMMFVCNDEGGRI